MDTAGDGKNVTPTVKIEDPVVNKGIKGLWNDLWQLVVVGGDLV